LIPKGGEPLIFESSFIRVTPEPTKAAVLYLFYYLSNQRVREQQIERFVTQSTISGINQSNLRQLPVTVPPLKLQQEFVERVLSLKKAQQSSLVSLHNLGALFASLQHRAFRGEL
jgi:type I restriction enzyme S subunit